MSRVILKKVNIVDADCDCVVNAANTALRAGGGVCGAIFEAAGYEELTKACTRLAPVKTGSAAITPAFNMKQKFIIHAVGPVWAGGGNGEEYLLKSAYRSALDLAVQNNCHSIAFPLISSGIYGYPKAEAWKAALEEVYDFLKDTRGSGVDIDIYFTALDDGTLWMGKDEIDRQQAIYDSWCVKNEYAPALYDDNEDVAGIFETRMEEYSGRTDELSQDHRMSDNSFLNDPGFLERSMNIPYLDPELLYSDTSGPAKAYTNEQPIDSPERAAWTSPDKSYTHEQPGKRSEIEQPESRPETEQPEREKSEPDNSELKVTYSDGFVFFWNDDEDNGFLSQWYRADMEVDGVKYSSCEQYMMAKKALAMGDIESYILIMHENDPARIKQLGREVRNFDRDKWSSAAPKVIYDGNMAKFSQNTELKERLLDTGSAILAEASPVDNIYGIGFAADDEKARIPSEWTGQNLMGKTLMKVREALAASDKN